MLQTYIFSALKKGSSAQCVSSRGRRVSLYAGIYPLVETFNYNCAITEKYNHPHNFLKYDLQHRWVCGKKGIYRRSWYFDSNIQDSLMAWLAGVHLNPVFLFPPSQAISESTIFE